MEESGESKILERYLSDWVACGPLAFLYTTGPEVTGAFTWSWTNGRFKNSDNGIDLRL